jgi:hypothetical protein
MTSPTLGAPTCRTGVERASRKAKRVCLMSIAQLANCPRIVKAADALADAGYNVRVVSSQNVEWSLHASEQLQAGRRSLWRADNIKWGSRNGRGLYLLSGLRTRAARAYAKRRGVDHVPMGIVARAYSRIFPELLQEALAEPADLYYGFARTLAEAAQAAVRCSVPYALDLEDFYSEELEPGAQSHLTQSLAQALERAILPGAAFLTAGSAAIAEAYHDTYDVQPVTINNTFPLPLRAPTLEPSRNNRLRLYWFSQTIGPRRGLEDAVVAAGLVGTPLSLTLRGLPIPSYVDDLCRLARAAAPNLEIEICPPAPPEEMIALAEGFDVGLALEQPYVLNRDICLTNKAFTYLLAGLAVIFTDTRGQRALATDLGSAAFSYAPGDVTGLAIGLARWANDRAALGRAKAAAWAAAKRRWHWEHEEEQGALVQAVDRVLNVQRAV